MPQSKGTVRPVLDTGYKTVVSSTPIPAVFESQRPTDRPDDSSTQPKTYLNFGVSFDDGDYTSTTLGLTDADLGDATTVLNKGNFGQKINGNNRNRNYQPFTSNNKQVIKNIGLNIYMTTVIALTLKILISVSCNKITTDW